MSVRNLLPIALLFATGLVACTESPFRRGTVTVTQTRAPPRHRDASAGPWSHRDGPAGNRLGVGHRVPVSADPVGGVPPYVVAWNFGDGGAGAGLVAAHPYDAPGSFTATATVTDSKAISAAATLPVSIAA